MTFAESFLLATFIVVSLVVFSVLVLSTIKSLDGGAWSYKFFMVFVWILAIGLLVYIGNRPL